ncbi:coiled-coil domain-containing protein 103-like isoform X1 [Halichondria panicea]|uniref:coiled-coil domain-containing protein 103-like isoform X1 n=1 Tax=Halichondria panicea TaxID=6063 RepID=UPI00312B4B35
MSGEGRIDLNKLERELVGALQADRKYSRENDAKFRAVSQRVATYEEFREIVNASHLNPLERKDVMDTARKQPWNMVAHLGRGEAMSEGPQAGTEDQHSSTLPKNGQDFMRAWRQLKHKGSIDQYKYLLNIGGVGLHKVFKVEISMELLGEMLQVLRDGYTANDTEHVLCILSQLSKSSRFGLSVTFLSVTEKKAVTELFQQLSTSETEQSLYDISEIAKLYSCNAN